MVAPASKPATGMARTPSHLTYSATESAEATAMRTVYVCRDTDFLPCTDPRIMPASVD
jgi:hypothetical protein